MLNLSNKVKTNLVHLAGLRVTGSIPNVVKRFNSLPGVDALEYNHVNLNTLARYTGDGIKKGRVKRWKRVYESWQSRIVTEDILSFTMVLTFDLHFDKIHDCVGKASSTAANQNHLMTNSHSRLTWLRHISWCLIYVNTENTSRFCSNTHQTSRQKMKTIVKWQFSFPRRILT